MHGPVLYAANWTLAVKVSLFFPWKRVSNQKGFTIDDNESEFTALI